MLTSAFYQKKEAAPRFGFWYCGLGAGQIIGGLISFAAQHSKSTTFQGWRIMFLSIGLVNFIVATAVFFWLSSTPEDATFLKVAEKEFVAKRLEDDHAGVGIKILRVRSILETFLDLQTWLLCLLTIFNVIPSGVITTYSSILIRNFGFTPKQAALLNMPSGIVSIGALMGSTYVIAKGYQRWAAIIIALLVTMLGACLMSFSPKTNQPALLAGIYLINAVSSCPPVISIAKH
jgi:hypothetical protein